MRFILSILEKAAKVPVTTMSQGWATAGRECAAMEIRICHAFLTDENMNFRSDSLVALLDHSQFIDVPFAGGMHVAVFLLHRGDVELKRVSARGPSQSHLRKRRTPVFSTRCCEHFAAC